MPEYILPVTAPSLEQMSSPDPYLEQLPGSIDTHVAEPVSDKKQFQEPDMLSKMASTPNTESRYEPQTFDWDKTGAQRFVNSDHYKTSGFDPNLGEGNELKYAQQQTGWDETGRMFRGFGNGLIHGFWDQAKSIGNFVTALAHPSLMNSFTQGQLEEINKKQLEFDNQYHIFQGDDPTVYSHVAKGIQSTGGLIGSVGELAAETILTNAVIAGTFGAAAPLEGAESLRWGQLLGKAANIGESVDAGARIASNAAKVAESITTPSSIGKLWTNIGEFASNVGSKLPGIGNTVGYTGDLLTYGAEGGAAATIGRGIGALTSDIRGINLATSFASGNAAATYQQSVNDQTEQYKKTNGRDPGFADLQSIKDRAMKSAKVDGALNAWALLFTEKMAFANILGSRTTLQEAVEKAGLGERIGVKPLAEQESAPLYVKQQAKWYDMKANYMENGKYITNTAIQHGGSFGAINVLMSGIDKSVKSYYDAKFDNKDIDGYDAIRKGIDSQFSKEGAGTFISGFLQGALIMGLGGAALKGVGGSAYRKITGDRGIDRTAENTEQATQAQEFVDKVNEQWKDPLNPIKETIHNMVLQNSMGYTAQENLSNGDRKGYHDIKDDASREFLLSMIRSNLADMWVGRAMDYSHNLPPEELCKLMKVDYTPENYKAIQEEINQLPGRVKDLRRINREVEGKIGTPFNPYVKDPQTGERLYKDGTPEFYVEQNNARIHREAKDYLIMLRDNGERGLVRKDDILNGKGDATGIVDMPFAKDLSTNTIYNALSLEELDKTIADYNQILSIGKDASAQKGKETAESYRIALQQFHDEYNTILNKGAYPERQQDINALLSLYKDELTRELRPMIEESLVTRDINGKIIERTPPPAYSDIADAMDKMLDYHRLSIEQDRVMKILSVLSDPAIIRKYQMSFMKEGTKRQAEAQEEPTADTNTTTNQPTNEKTDQEGNQESTAGAQPEEEKAEEAPVTKPTQTTLPELPMIKADIMDYYTKPQQTHEGEGEVGDMDIAATTHTPMAEHYLATNPELRQLLSAYEGVYNNKADVGHKDLKSILDWWFDRNIQPLDYSHLPGSPKVTEKDGLYYIGDNGYKSLSDANKALQEKYPTFTTGNRTLQVGQHLYDDKGHRYILTGRDTVKRDTPKGKEKQVTEEELDNQYTTKEPEGKTPIPKARLFDIGEQTEIRPPGYTDAEKSANQKIIDEVLSRIPPSEFSKHFSIVVTPNKPDPKGPNYPFNRKIDGLWEINPYITQVREPYTLAIHRIGKDSPMFYMTPPGKFIFNIPGKGTQLIPDKEDFHLVFDIRDKTLDSEYNKWVQDYNKSQQLAAVIDKLKGEGTITGEKLAQYLDIHIGNGQYDYISKGEEDRRPTVADTIASGKELLGVIDWRTGETVHGTIPKDVQMPKDSSSLGNFRSLFKLPNGNTHWVELATTVYPKEEIDSLVTEYVDKASKDIRELMSTGHNSEATNLAKLATDKLSGIFITQNPSKKITVTLTPMRMGLDGYIHIGYKLTGRDSEGNVIKENKEHHIIINAGYQKDAPLNFNGNSEDLISTIEKRTNDYFKKNNLPEIEIKPENVRKSYSLDADGKIPKDLIGNSKITTSTNIVKNIKLTYDVRESALYSEMIPTQSKSSTPQLVGTNDADNWDHYRENAIDSIQDNGTEYRAIVEIPQPHLLKGFTSRADIIQEINKIYDKKIADIKPTQTTDINSLLSDLAEVGQAGMTGSEEIETPEYTPVKTADDVNKAIADSVGEDPLAVLRALNKDTNITTTSVAEYNRTINITGNSGVTTLYEPMLGLTVNQYKQAKLQGSDTTTSANDPASRLIQVGTDEYKDSKGNKITVPRYLPQEEGERISSTIAALYHLEAKGTAHNKAEVMGSILDKYMNMLNPEQDRYIGPQGIYRNLYKADKVNAVSWLRNLNDLYRVYKSPETRKELTESVNEHLKIMGYKQHLDDDKISRIENEKGPIAGYEDTADMKGGYESLSQDIREYISTVLKPYTDEFGNSELEKGVPLYQAVDGAKVYNGLSQLLRNCTGYDQMMEKLQGAKNNGDTGYVIRRLLSDVGYHEDQGKWDISKNSILLNQFLNGFNQMSVAHPTAEIDPSKGTSRSYEANRKDSAKVQMDMWEPAYEQIYLSGYRNISAKKTYAREHLKPLIELRNKITEKEHEYSNDQEFVQDAQDISNSIKDQLGLSIHPLYIQYSIAHNKEDKGDYMEQILATYSADPITKEDINGIRDSSLDNANVTGSIFNTGPEGAIQRLRTIAENNSIFDEDVDSTSYRDAEHNTRYGMQKPNYTLENVQMLNDSDHIASLQNNPDYSGNYLLSDDKFLNWKKEAGIVDGLSIRFHSVKGEDITTPDYLDVNRGDGTVMKKFNRRELNAYNIIQYGSNPIIQNGVYGSWVIPRIVSDKNTLYTISAPVIPSVYTDKSGQVKVTPEALDKLYSIVSDEITRIQQFRDSVDSMPESEKVLGYHTGEMRGMKFDRSKYLLGDKVKEIEDILAKGQDLPIRFREFPVKAIIERNILEQVNRYVEDELKPSGLINEDGTNNLLPEYLWKGFGDSKRNEGLNLKDNFQHNMAQVFISNYLNAVGLNWLKYGNETRLFKSDIDKVKREALANASGDSLGKPYSDPSLGILHPFNNIHIAVIKEPIQDGIKIADSQAWCTEKGMRYLLFGSGTLTKTQADILTKIEQGEEITKEEMFKAGGLIRSGEAFNSFKPVYCDGETGIKCSVFMLSRDMVMTKDRDGNLIPDIRYEGLYNLYMKMKEKEDSEEHVTLVYPESASKIMTKNVANSVDDITDSHWQPKDAKWLRKQTENPTNKLTITDSTQAKRQVLAEQIDDIKVTVDGKDTTIGQVKEQYMRDTSQRLTNNYNSAINTLFSIKEGLLDLTKGTDIKEVTPTLGKFYDHMRDMGMATGANSQTLGFYETRNGEPLYDLNFPATLKKYTEGVLNYFGDVMAEKVPGITATKLSGYGVQIIRKVTEVDERGVPVRWEVVPTHEYRNNPTLYNRKVRRYNAPDRGFTWMKVGDYILDHLRVNVPEYINGKPTGLMYNEAIMPAHHIEDVGKVPEVLSRMYSNRIPYDDKNKGAFSKVIDYLSPVYGSVMITPDQEAAASGEDFDLDKRFIHTQDTYSDGEKLIPYGNATTDKDKFEEYLMYQASKNSAVRDKVKKLEDTDEGMIASLLSQDRDIVIAAMRELRLPSTVEEFMKAGGDKLNNGVLNNRILDNKIALASNSHITGGDKPINLEPTDTKRLEDIVQQFQDKLSSALTSESLSPEEKKALKGVIASLKEPDIDINSMHGISLAAINNWEGKRNVGASANGVPSLSLLMHHNISLSGDGITINGIEHNTFGDTHNIKGVRKFAQMMTDINAMTDNAKLRLASKLGLSIDALSDAMAMSMIGVSLEDRQLLLLQPAVREYYRNRSNIGGKLKTKDEERLFKSTLLQKVIDKLEETKVKPTELTTDKLWNNIIHNGRNKSVELAALHTIQKASDIAGGLADVVKVMGLSGGMPSTWEGVDKIKESLNNLGVGISDGKVYKLEDVKAPFDVRDILMGKDPIVRTYIQMLAQIDKLSPMLFTERGMAFKRLQKTVLANFGTISPQVRDDFMETLKHDLISYLSIEAYKNSGKADISSLGQHLVYESVKNNKEDITAIVERLRDTLKGKKANYFVNKYLRIVKADESGNRDMINKATANIWAKLPDKKQMQIKDSLTQLITDPATRADGLAIFHYLLVKDGGQYRNNSFIKYVAPHIMKDLLDSTAKVTKWMAEGIEGENPIGKDMNKAMSEFLTAYGTHRDNVMYLKNIRNGIPSELKYLSFTPDGNINISIPDRVKSDNKLTDYIKSTGLSTTRTDKGYIAVELPMTIRVGRQLYKLANSDQYKGDISHGTKAVYVPEEPNGARNTYKAAGANYGLPPVVSQLLDSTGTRPAIYDRKITNPGYSPIQDTKVTTDIKPQENTLSPIIPGSEHSVAHNLYNRHGITVMNTGSKATAYKDGKVYTPPEGINSPKELLEHLDRTSQVPEEDMWAQLADMSDIGGGEGDEYNEPEIIEPQQDIVPSQQTSIDWKSEIDKLATGKSEGWIDRATDVYKSLQGKLPDSEILQRIKECI